MKIYIPTPLRAYTGKQDTVEVGGATIHEALGGLTSRYPDLRKHCSRTKASCGRL